MLLHRLLPMALLTGTLFSSCVSNKVYHAELSMREQCEARERVLVQEQLERRKESAGLTKQIGDLNRTIGNQEAEIKSLRNELTAQTQQLGESSNRLLTEKLELEKDLEIKNGQLGKQMATIQSVSSAQNSRLRILEELKSALLKNYPASGGTTVELGDQAVLLTLPDKSFFETDGLSVSSNGKKLLTPLAGLLANRPELDADIRAYTDNVLPKGAKNLQDTWDWSLARATNIVRLLIRDFNTNANQLTPVAKGEFYPLASNETPEGRQRNRRTVIAVYPKLPKVPVVE